MSSLCTERDNHDNHDNQAFCGQSAVVEKMGRSVCRRHANQLNGVEYPVRPPSWLNDRDLEIDLDMIDEEVVHEVLDEDLL